VSTPGRVQVAAVVRNKAIAFGAAGWLDDLPELIARLERDWQITVGRPYDSSTEAYVAEAVGHDGTLAVLKLMIPRDGNQARNEIAVLELTKGDGCVRLLRSDLSRGALLLERLGRRLDQLGLPITRRHEILCAAAERVWRPAAGIGLPTGAENGRWFIGFITATWEELGRPCSERAVADAIACAARRIDAHDDERAVLVHGDVHQWNVLEAPHGYKLVDPDGVLAEAEYDLGVVMREDPLELMHGDPGARARWLATRCALDATAIWEWGVIQRVATGLLCVKIEEQPVGRQMLAAADHLALPH
jgi:streptomycin 6-kinase